jgi:hypothetical protein
MKACFHGVAWGDVLLVALSVGWGRQKGNVELARYGQGELGKGDDKAGDHMGGEMLSHMGSQGRRGDVWSFGLIKDDIGYQAVGLAPGKANNGGLNH